MNSQKTIIEIEEKITKLMTSLEISDKVELIVLIIKVRQHYEIKKNDEKVKYYNELL